ncbi:hypothetical protein B0T20DRAFT_391473 [Sordaria brevicollis]|uniref:Zn(2)-C6 fungal-type domain-containing protein n=1 Tax=Sordaria brevicollis TaxID=83679 RepID=A0AAE0PI41_SORBR|nr:hypothetical protein B0T20DRAFT_391473 [Sordaria brevicollis]
MGWNDDEDDNTVVDRHAPEPAFDSHAALVAIDHSAEPVPTSASGSSSSSNATASMPSGHGDIPPAAVTSGTGPGPVRRQKKRAQVSKACQRCRRLQKGCSESRPCQRCIGVGLEDQCLRSEMAVECHRGGSSRNGGHHHSQSLSQTQVSLPRSQPGMVEPVTAAAATVTATGTWSFTQLPASPESLVGYPLISSGAASATSPHQAQHLQPGVNPVPRAVLDHCISRFFSRLYPTIPILTHSYVDQLLHVSSSQPSKNEGAEAQTLLLSLSALVLLQIEHPTSQLFTSHGVPHSNSVYGRLLFEEAQASHHRALAQRRFAPTLERVLITFFLYACHAVLFHHSQAFFWLREATTLWVVLRIDDGSGTQEGEARELARVRKSLANRLFWVLLVSERSHGIRYRRPITLQITPATPSLDFCTDPEFAGLASLVALFRQLDTGFMSLLNEEVTSASLFASPAMVAAPLDVVEKSIAEAVPGPSPAAGPLPGLGSGSSPGSVSLPSMSPDGRLLDSMPASPTAGQAPCLLPTGHLHTTQVANLKITQLWLRVILWQIRLRIGLLIPPPPRPTTAVASSPIGATGVKESLTYHHPLSIAHELVAVTKSLPLESIRVHGVGLTEKVFDIACAMVDVLAKVPLEDRRPASLLMTKERQEEEEREDLEWIRGLIHRLSGGEAIYDGLLGRHIACVLPGWSLRGFKEDI